MNAPRVFLPSPIRALRRLFAGAACLSLIAILVWPSTSFAQSYCVPEAFGVPALSGPPVWWTGGAEPQNWPRLDDPRWRGALAHSWGSGASEQVIFRALKKTESGTPYLYLSWWVRVDPLLTPLTDKLYVAFSPGGGAADILIGVTPFQQNTVPEVAAGVAGTTNSGSVSVARRVGGAWDTSLGTPQWLLDTTRVWMDPVNQEWAVNMRVPVAAAFNDGINLGTDFRMWFQVDVVTPDNGLVPYHMGTLTYADIGTGSNASNWPEFNRTLALGSAGCKRGISLAASDVGTKYVDSGGNARPNRINVTGVNTFFAQPMNESGTGVPTDAIQATFRIANWGTQPDWNVVPVAGSLWKQINSGPVTNPGIIPNGTKASAAAGNELTFNWTLPLTSASPGDLSQCDFIGRSGVPASQTSDHVAIPGNLSCPNATPTRRLHQCMLVELSGGGFDYTPASVYRNMDFVDASKFERQAEVSVVGLPAIPGATHRAVYLYTKTYNMPAPGKLTPVDVLRNLDRLRPILSKDRESTALMSTRAAVNLPTRDQQATRAVRPSMGIPFDLMSQVFPTYVVNAYHDTGRTITVDGHSYRWLEPQTSFGYYVYHEGKASGWNDALQGATQIAPNYYKIDVPEGGTAEVQTTISAVQPGIAGICGSLRSSVAGLGGGSLAIIGIAVYWPLRRRRKNNKERKDE